MQRSGDLAFDGNCFAGERDQDETQDHVLIAFEPSNQSSNFCADPAKWNMARSSAWQ